MNMNDDSSAGPCPKCRGTNTAPGGRCRNCGHTWDASAALVADLTARLERAEAERDALLAACKVARQRFGRMNGEVSRKVWDDNLPACVAIDDAVRLVVLGMPAPAAGEGSDRR